MKIFVVGMPGSGKTHWGKIWANRLQLTFFDLDLEIEKRTQKSIATIFTEIGEEGFRYIENQILTELCSSNNFLLACGGGTPCFYNQMDLMNENGATVYINSTPAELVARLEQNLDSRPLLQEAELLNEQIIKMLEQRLPTYQRAQFTILSSHLHEDALKIIFNKSIN
jgi:shikimate kinase